MKISYNWLKDYIKINIEPEKVAEILTDIGLEVESTETIESIKGGLEGVIAGKVITCIKHPDADKLSITEVDTGCGELLNIVCGAPNVAAGQKVLVAPVGTTLYPDGEPFKIKKVKIRGVLSEGMICAEDELGVGESHDGIMILDHSIKIGTPARDLFMLENDTIFEIGLTPNRIDAASHYGVARDLAAFLKLSQNITLQKPDVSHFKTDNTSLHIPVEIQSPEGCYRYCGLTISGVDVKESPEWMKKRLVSIGLRPINNVVDITNYILHETGQPLHAFDADKISGKKVVVKTMPEGTVFKTLDEVDRKLSETDLMICDENDAMCMAGVFGGLNSGVTENTRNIFLECAYFNPVWIRKSSKRHLLNTDSSFRFERGVDPEIQEYVIKRAALMIKEIAGGKISSELIDNHPVKSTPNIVEVSFSNIRRLIGKDISSDIIKKILVSLDIIIQKEENDFLSLVIPSYRVDVLREADVIEDILRIYGYNNIEISPKVNSTITYSPNPDNEKLKNLASDFLCGNGFFEMWNNSLTRSSYHEIFPSILEEKYASLFNPLSSDLNVMRQSLLPGVLTAVEHNVNRKSTDLQLFEFGYCYSMNSGDKSLPVTERFKEEEHLAIVITGQNGCETWFNKTSDVTFFDIKNSVEKLLLRLGFNPESFETNETMDKTFAFGLDYSRNKMQIMSIGQINSSIMKKMGIDQDVFYADIIWGNVIIEMQRNKVKFRELPKYPEVRRDLALLLDKSVKFEDIRKAALIAERRLLKKVNLFDVYEGKNLSEGKKSYAVSFILQDEEKTLTDERIDKVMNNLLSAFKTECGAQLR